MTFARMGVRAARSGWLDVENTGERNIASTGRVWARDNARRECAAVVIVTSEKRARQ